MGKRKLWIIDNPEKYMWGYYRANANRTKDGLVLPFELEKEAFEKLVFSECYYCGAPPKPVNGIDRVDNRLGYLSGNVVSCCRRCNRAKDDMTVEEFLGWVEKLAKKQFPADLDRVEEFFHKFDLPRRPTPGFLDPDVAEFRARFMEEELTELHTAIAAGDLPSAADALVDACYILLGTAVMMGLPWAKLFENVQAANMKKIRAAPDGSDSKRGSPLDVVKPENWQPPNHVETLMQAGWLGPALPLEKK